MSTLRAGFDDYSVEDLRAAYGRGGWRDWSGLVQWLEESGVDDDSLDQSSVYHLAADLRQLDNDGIDFTTDPAEAFALARQHCSHVDTVDEGGDPYTGYAGEREHVEP
ncbi:MAG: hypothetical protein IBX62_05125 [Coriobacteriia bacterium]|nr:hypothetical protein [Coriobacteriia bacterium]